MAPDRRSSPEQERSINERKRALYVADEDLSSLAPTKPFAVYLKETPADPIPTSVKAVLWALGIIVALLFVASIWRIQRSYRTRPKPPPPAAAIHAQVPGHLMI